MDLVFHRKEIAQALSQLEQSLATLVDQLAHENAIVTLDDESETAPIRRVCEAYATLDYDMTDDANTSIVCLGVVGVSKDTARQAQLVNTLKAKFKKLCAPLHRVQVRVPVKEGSSATRKLSAMRVILRNIQRSDLNLLAAYRKIPLLSASPSRITYTRANTRSVYRKSVADIQRVLSIAEGSAAAADRARLEALPARVTHLAQVTDRYANVRANVVYAHLDPRGRGRTQVAAELPLMYIQGTREPPVVSFDPVQKHPIRRPPPPELEAAPFLQSIAVYRYLEDCRLP